MFIIFSKISVFPSHFSILHMIIPNPNLINKFQKTLTIFQLINFRITSDNQISTKFYNALSSQFENMNLASKI